MKREATKKLRLTLNVVRFISQKRDAVHSTTTVQSLYKAGLYESAMRRQIHLSLLKGMLKIVS